jgi:hypothetical protein
MQVFFSCLRIVRVYMKKWPYLKKQDFVKVFWFNVPPFLQDQEMKNNTTLWKLQQQLFKIMVTTYLHFFCVSFVPFLRLVSQIAQFGWVYSCRMLPFRSLFVPVGCLVVSPRGLIYNCWPTRYTRTPLEGYCRIALQRRLNHRTPWEMTSLLSVYYHRTPERWRHSFLCTALQVTYISKHFTCISAKSFTKSYTRKHKATLQQNLIMKFSQNNSFGSKIYHDKWISKSIT